MPMYCGPVVKHGKEKAPRHQKGKFFLASNSSPVYGVPHDNRRKKHQKYKPAPRSTSSNQPLKIDRLTPAASSRSLAAEKKRTQRQKNPHTPSATGDQSRKLPAVHEGIIQTKARP
ncbi:hypothetical protein PMG11_03905 [Penicillium brasilianum]|uniref:Uncharacterized protein n=1 Tax=Penicillium brasilianum TaxID=104259 RepID=A0A0F7VER5_PENBI|nr:hypothetical protein PMG11_03905 [Penicillium brasilianum]